MLAFAFTVPARSLDTDTDTRVVQMLFGSFNDRFLLDQVWENVKGRLRKPTRVYHNFMGTSTLGLVSETAFG